MRCRREKGTCVSVSFLVHTLFFVHCFMRNPEINSLGILFVFLFRISDIDIKGGKVACVEKVAGFKLATVIVVFVLPSTVCCIYLT